jgi:hypothetical protein
VSLRASGTERGWRKRERTGPSAWVCEHAPHSSALPDGQKIVRLKGRPERRLPVGPLERTQITLPHTRRSYRWETEHSYRWKTERMADVLARAH